MVGKWCWEVVGMLRVERKRLVGREVSVGVGELSVEHPNDIPTVEKRPDPNC